MARNIDSDFSSCEENDRFLAFFQGFNLLEHIYPTFGFLLFSQKMFDKLLYTSLFVTEAFAWRCSIEKVFLKILQNS